MFGTQEFDTKCHLMFESLSFHGSRGFIITTDTYIPVKLITVARLPNMPVDFKINTS